MAGSNANNVPVQGASAGGGGGAQDVTIVGSIDLNTISIPVSNSTNALSFYTSGGSLQGSVGISIKATGAGRLYYTHGFHVNAATRYIMLFDTFAVPGNFAVPTVTIQVGGNGSWSLDLNPFGEYFSSGIAIAYSTTATVLTLGADECKFHVGFK